MASRASSLGITGGGGRGNQVLIKISADIANALQGYKVLQTQNQNLVKEVNKLNQAVGNTDKTGGMKNMQKGMTSVEGGIARLNRAFGKLGVQLETVDLFFISGLKFVALSKLTQFIGDSVKEASRLEDAFRGLGAVAEQAGFRTADAMKAVHKAAEDGQIPIRDLTESMRNLLKKGFDPEQALRLIEAIKATGIAFGTQADMPLGEATRRVTEGILLDMSRLVDATRVGKNLVDIWRDFAKEAGIVNRELTNSEKNLAVLAEFEREAAPLKDTVEEIKGDVSGLFRELGEEWNKFKRNLGGDLEPTTKVTVKAVGGVVGQLEELRKEAVFVGTVLGGVKDVIVQNLLVAYKNLKGDTEGATEQMREQERVFEANQKAIFGAFQSLDKYNKLVLGMGKDPTAGKTVLPIVGPLDKTLKELKDANDQVEKEVIQLQRNLEVFTNALIDPTQVGRVGPTIENLFNRKLQDEKLEQRMAVLLKPEPVELNLKEASEGVVEELSMGIKQRQQELEEIANAFTRPFKNAFSQLFQGLFSDDELDIIGIGKDFAARMASEMANIFIERWVERLGGTQLFEGLLGIFNFGTSSTPSGGSGGGLDFATEVDNIITADPFAASSQRGSLTVNVGPSRSPEQIAEIVKQVLRDQGSYDSRLLQTAR